MVDSDNTHKDTLAADKQSQQDKSRTAGQGLATAQACERARGDRVVGELANKAKDVAGQVWLAGLGAYAKVEQEGGKWFDTLVKDGERLEERTRDLLDRQLSFYRDKVGGVREKVEEVKDMATNSIDRLEKAFDERVSRALARLKIPSHKEVQNLRQELKKIKNEVEALKRAQNEAGIMSQTSKANEDSRAHQSAMSDNPVIKKPLPPRKKLTKAHEPVV